MKKNISEHNLRQVSYFERNVKKTMIPTESLYISRQVEVLIKIANLTQKDDILEIGCGMGRYTVPLLNRGFNVSGLDISDSLLKKLEKYAPINNPKLYCCDVIDASGKINKKFDKIIGCFTLHHVHNLKAVFNAIKDLLKPKGKVVFLEPNPLNLLYYVQILWTPNMKWSMEKGMTRLRKNTVFNLLKETGFKNQSLHRFGFLPPFLTNTKTGLMLEGKFEKISLLYPFLPFQVFMAGKNGA